MISFWLAIVLVVVIALIAGAIASVAGFGVGSLLTPLLGLLTDMKAAVAIVSIPHLVGTALRLFMLRRHVDRRVLWSFGLTSAAGGLAGALLGTFLRTPALTIVLGCLLLLAGVTGLTGMTDRMRFGGRWAWLAGAVSGVFGGLVGNQGGIRSAALLGFDLPKEAFVATATAVALMVDGARMPIYFATQASDIANAWPFVIAATVGTVAGTLLGERVLMLVPEATFRKIVAAIISLLGLALLVSGARSILF
jgi:uncharacterized protein